MSSAPRSNRREFLQGKAAAEALAALAWHDPTPLEFPPSSPESYLLRLSRRAMACTFELFFNAGQYAHATESAVAALDLVNRLEDRLSIYREQSEISQLNRLAAERPIAVESDLFELLQTAARIHAETQGAYDITAGRLSTAWGFTRRSGAIPSPEVLAEAREHVGSHYLELDPHVQTVRFLNPGLEVNLGSIGKGFALDQCAALLQGLGIDNFLLHGGNSSVLGRGAHGASTLEQGWSVGIRNPLRPDRRLGHLRLKDRALATSGSGTQFFMHQGRRYGHILDPRTGWPAEGVLSVSVLAPTATEADALSTAFYVLGPGPMGEYCIQRPDLAAIMLCPGQREGSLEIHRFGLDETDWTESNES